MEFLSVKQYAEKWGLTEQQVRSYCRDKRIPGAFFNKGIWYIPMNAKKPSRKKRNIFQESPLPPLARKICRQMKRKSYHGLYDYIQINLGYSSCRMASVRLTRNQVETIFRKGKVNVGFEPLKVSDLVEILNHFICIEYLFKRINEPLTSRIIRETHYRLMFGTVDQRKHKVTPGEYRTSSVKRKDRELVPAEEIKDRLKLLVENYESLAVVERRDILDFHVRFAELARLKAEQGISDEEFYHFDTPLTVQHETEALLEAGFSSVEVLQHWGVTHTLKAKR